MPSLRPYLVLGRVSNVPTVWSNCLAGWLLGGGGPAADLLVLSAAATLLYIGGMYLNDAFDAAFDRQYRKERPIPSGAVSARTVWVIGFVLILSGLIAPVARNGRSAVLALALAGAIVLYDAIHKRIAWSPVLMASCRFLLYLLAGTWASEGMNSHVLAAALAMTCFIIGLSYIARRESTFGAMRYWPLLFLAAPFPVAFWLRFVGGGGFGWTEIAALAAAALWTGSRVRFVFGSTPAYGRAVAGLLAGICLIDWSFVPATTPAFFAFPVLFLLALVFQRTVPAT